MSRMSLRSLYDRFYLPMRLALASEHCRYQYRLNIRKFGEWLGREAEIADLSDDNLALYAGYLVGQKRTPGTANKIVGQLKALWNFAARVVVQFESLLEKSADTRKKYLAGC